MNDFRYLVTGANGCIGAWVVRDLADEGAVVIALDASRDDHRLKLIMSAEQLASVKVIQADITDLGAMEAVVKEQGITHLIHLAALQVPFCKADPALGARVNVVGTVNLFEAARKAGIRHLAYASSIGVFGLSEEYPDGVVNDESDPRPRSLYGVYKQANEATARVYWWDHGISSIGLRPYVVYGPGRDQGMTSSPTWAMLAAAAGRPYRITYGGRSGLNYVDDIARLFIQTSRISPGKAETLNVSGSLVDMPEILEAIFRSVPEANQWLSFTPTHLPLPDGTEDKKLRALLPGFQQTVLTEGVANTIELFRQALQDGRVRADQIPG
jgi:nucleoside-diphosphate-sugar epimerase